MKASKVILNDKGRPITKDQAKRELRDILLARAIEAYEAFGDGVIKTEIYFDGAINEDSEITFGDLLKRCI